MPRYKRVEDRSPRARLVGLVVAFLVWALASAVVAWFGQVLMDGDAAWGLVVLVMGVENAAVCLLFAVASAMALSRQRGALLVYRAACYLALIGMGGVGFAAIQREAIWLLPAGLLLLCLPLLAARSNLRKLINRT